MNADEIYEFCVEEMYLLCYEHNLPDAWTYLYDQWYSPDSWRQWAHSGVPGRIPVGNTTMLMEAHWKVLKRNHMYHYNRARLNLLVYVMMNRHSHDLILKFHNFVVHRREPGSWERGFAAAWREARRKRRENPTTDTVYQPSIERWVCGC